MDTTSLYYFIELSKELHMTRTAERLFISQQTLSNHILRLEQQLGCRLLDRKPSLSLTYAGEQVLRFAEDMVRNKDNLERILAEINEQDRGIIRFGASALRMNDCLPAILPEFAARYPEVEFRLTDYVSSDLEPMILSGDLDFAIVAEGNEDPSLIIEPLLDDPVYLCVPESLLSSYCGDNWRELKRKAINGADLADFGDLPFCMFENRLGHKIQQCFAAQGISPRTRFTGHYSRIITTIGLDGLAAFFGTRTSLSSRESDIPDDMNIFPLTFQGEPLYQRVRLIRSPRHFMTRYDNYFRELIFKHFAELNKQELTRIAPD